MTPQPRVKNATIDDVEHAVQRAITPLAQRVTVLEEQLHATITAPEVQAMIERATETQAAKHRVMLDEQAAQSRQLMREQSEHYREIIKSLDEHLRQVEQNMQRVSAVTDSAAKNYEGQGKRVDELDHRLDSVEADARGVRIGLYGDATAKDAPPSLYRLVEELPARVKSDFDMALAAVHKQLEAQTAVLNDHTAFIERRRAIENRVIFSLRTILKNPRLLALIVGAGGLTAGIIEFLKALAGG